MGILSDTKKILGVLPEDDAFDLDITTHVNSAISDLNDIGVGPTVGLTVDPDSDWSVITDDETELNRVKTFVYLKVRMLFDPPATSYLINAMERQINEATWRLSVAHERTGWTDPSPPVLVEDE